MRNIIICILFRKSIPTQIFVLIIEIFHLLVKIFGISRTFFPNIILSLVKLCRKWRWRIFAQFLISRLILRNFLDFFGKIAALNLKHYAWIFRKLALVIRSNGQVKFWPLFLDFIQTILTELWGSFWSKMLLYTLFDDWIPKIFRDKLTIVAFKIC